MKQLIKNRLDILRALTDSDNWSPNFKEIVFKLDHSPVTISKYYDNMKPSLFVEIILKNEIEPVPVYKAAIVSNDVINKTNDTMTLNILTELRDKKYWRPRFTRISNKTGLSISTIYDIYGRNKYRFRINVRFKIVVCPKCGNVGGESDYNVATKHSEIEGMPVIHCGFGCRKCQKSFGFDEEKEKRKIRGIRQ